jgi:two-component system sensor histidine kinase/response regulator
MKNTVLLVEDSRSFALSVEAAIKRDSSFEVIIAFNYEQTVELVNANRHEIFIAVTDLILPDAEGAAAVKLMAQENIPCIAFTGNFSSQLRGIVLDFGVADYVLKKSSQDIDYVVRTIKRLSTNRKLQLLVVDKARSSREILKTLLQQQCYDVTAVRSAQHALDLLADGHQFRIVLIDLIMDEIDNFELLDAFRKNNDVTKMSIIGVSDQASSEQIAKFMKYGGNDFLLKPFQQEQVACRVNANAQLLDQFDYLNELNEQKNVLLGMAAHDIRGPLSVVICANSMLAREVQSDHAKMLVGMTSKAADAMEALLNSLLDISSIESANISISFQKISLTLLLREVVQDMRLIAQDKMQQLDLEVSVQEIWINADSLRIKEVIQNLISNAIKYSLQNSKISVCLSSNRSKARIEVIDEAGGIPPDEQHLLFQAFAKISTQPTAGEQSMGLGLSICKKIISLHSGEINYRSNRMGGSVFEVVLPLLNDV